MTTPTKELAELQEPDTIPIGIDMTTTGEREFVPVGQPVYSLFVAELALGTTRIEFEINGRWIRLQQGDTWESGDCFPTRRGIRVRTQPALAGLFSLAIIGGTPDTIISRA